MFIHRKIKKEKKKKKRERVNAYLPILPQIKGKYHLGTKLHICPFCPFLQAARKLIQR